MMASQSRRNSKGYSGTSSENGRKGSKEATPEFTINPTTISAPKYGTVVPERVFVGGISMSMSESELTEFFSKYGKVIDTKIIVDRAGVSKGYGFITFETEEEANKLLADADNIMLRERKLNIAQAIKKQSFNQRLDVPNGAASMVGTPLFGSLPFTFHNGVTYFCHHANGTAAMSAPQPAAPQQPPPQTAPPSTPTPHIDPNLYTGYGNIQAPAPQYHQVVYNPPFYYQAAQYQYPITTCEAVEGSMTDGVSMQGGGMSTANPQVGQVLLAPNGYYLQEINPYQDYTYPAHPYVYQPAPEPQPQPHPTAVIQYSPASASPAPSRPIYDSPLMVPEVFPAPQTVYPRPPSTSNPSFPHYSTNHFNNNSAGNFLRKFRRPYHPQSVKGRGGGRGGGSVSSYSSGGGGGGLVTPPSTPRSGQPSPDHQPAQSVASSTQDHLVHSMKTLKAA